MHILVLDGGHVEAEFRAKFGPAHQYSFFSTGSELPTDWSPVEQAIAEAVTAADVVFCFEKTRSRSPSHLLAERATCPVFIEILKDSLSALQWEAVNGPSVAARFGFCGLPTLLNRSLLEVSLSRETDREKLAETCAALGTDYRVVADRVGLVTPRVVCMIINEACYTVQEGTATMPAVDLGMQLGTNYPRGPFAWANAIGVVRVYAVLEALWHDTHEERYKSCPLLKRQALRGEPFQLAD